MWLSLQYLYLLVGAVLAMTALLTLADRSNPRRYTSSAFWGIYALVFLLGDQLPLEWVGLGAIVMALIAGLGGVAGGRQVARSAAQYLESAGRIGHKLFVPALAIPLITMVGTLSAKHVTLAGLPLIDPKNATLISLGVGCLLALGLACWLCRETPVQGMRESHRLTDALGWAIVLPQMLGMLGLVFSEAGVGKAVAHVATTYVNMDIRFVAVAVYVLGMALFTVIMGNGFAAFPVMTGGVGIPVLVGVYHGDPAVMAAIGMLSGYCGTLMTPMAANFNLVPAALLEIDKNAVIRAQVPTALLLLTANVFLLYFLMFR
jgi:uncharacterized membrane protein